MHKHAEALQACDRALSINAHDLDTLCNRGDIRMALGNYEEGVLFQRRCTSASSLTNAAAAIKDFQAALRVQEGFDRVSHARPPSWLGVWLTDQR
jgi:tetratricopeptide (TPR) repeat protein